MDALRHLPFLFKQNNVCPESFSRMPSVRITMAIMIFFVQMFLEISGLFSYRFSTGGVEIFDSADFTKGWDGKVGGMMQVSAVYVWLCHYQFEGETENSKSGTVLLLR